jgi:hypothetical protein
LAITITIVSDLKIMRFQFMEIPSGSGLNAKLATRDQINPHHKSLIALTKPKQYS